MIRKLQYRDAVERLIGLLHSSPEQPADPVVQRHALDALRDITHENFGTDAATWAAWWQANADRLFGA